MTKVKEEKVVENLPVATARRELAPSALDKMANKKYVDEFKAGELMIPWLTIVQTSSGFMKKNKPSYIEEAREGDIIDTLSRRLRASQTVILVKYEMHYTTWEPGGGKLVKQWFTDPTAYNAASFPEGRDFGTKVDAAGNEIKPAATYYILAVDTETGAAEPMTMAWGSTQIGKTKRLNSLARADMAGSDGLPFTPPIYARLFDLGTKGESNAKNAWAGWTFEVGEVVLAHPKFGEMWYAKAEAFREQIEKGNVRPQPPLQSEDDTREADGESASAVHTRAAGSEKLNDEIPY